MCASAFNNERPHLPERITSAAYTPGKSNEQIQAALASAQEAIRLWIDTAKEFGDTIPEPKGRRLIFA
jgi:predicted RNase H-like HicB family nuclease